MGQCGVTPTFIAVEWGIDTTTDSEGRSATFDEYTVEEEYFECVEYLAVITPGGGNPNNAYQSEDPEEKCPWTGWVKAQDSSIMKTSWIVKDYEAIPSSIPFDGEVNLTVDHRATNYRCEANSPISPNGAAVRFELLSQMSSDVQVTWGHYSESGQLTDGSWAQSGRIDGYMGMTEHQPAAERRFGITSGNVAPGNPWKFESKEPRGVDRPDQEEVQWTGSLPFIFGFGSGVLPQATITEMVNDGALSQDGTSVEEDHWVSVAWRLTFPANGRRAQAENCHCECCDRPFGGDA